MRLPCLGLAAGLLSVGLPGATGDANGERFLEQVNIPSCRIVVAAFETAGILAQQNEDQYLYQCILDEESPVSSVFLGLPEDFTTAWQEDLFAGHSFVSISNATMFHPGEAVHPHVLISDGATITFIEAPDRRRLEPKKEGTSSVLVLRITAPDSNPTLTKDELSARVFGIGAGAPSVNLKSQMDS